MRRFPWDKKEFKTAVLKIHSLLQENKPKEEILQALGDTYIEFEIGEMVDKILHVQKIGFPTRAKIFLGLGYFMFTLLIFISLYILGSEISGTTNLLNVWHSALIGFTLGMGFIIYFRRKLYPLEISFGIPFFAILYMNFMGNTIQILFGETIGSFLINLHSILILSQLLLSVHVFKIFDTRMFKIYNVLNGEDFHL